MTATVITPSPAISAKNHYAAKNINYDFMRASDNRPELLIRSIEINAEENRLKTIRIHLMDCCTPESQHDILAALESQEKWVVSSRMPHDIEISGSHIGKEDARKVLELLRLYSEGGELTYGGLTKGEKLRACHSLTL